MPNSRFIRLALASRMTAAALFAMFLSGFAPPAAADLPFLAESQPLGTIGNDQVMLVVLRGDGILGPDPVRAVVVDAKGWVLAASPIGYAYSLICSNTEPACASYDHLSQTLFQPLPAEWKTAGRLLRDGKPVLYPEDIGDSWGFRPRSVSFNEALSFEGMVMARDWPFTLAVGLWWATFWRLLLPLFNWFATIEARHRPGAVVLRLSGALAMLGAAGFLALIQPYSWLYFWVVLCLGAVLAVLSIRLQHKLARWRVLHVR